MLPADCEDVRAVRVAQHHVVADAMDQEVAPLCLRFVLEGAAPDCGGSGQQRRVDPLKLVIDRRAADGRQASCATAKIVVSATTPQWVGFAAACWKLQRQHRQQNRPARSESQSRLLSGCRRQRGCSPVPKAAKHRKTRKQKRRLDKLGKLPKAIRFSAQSACSVCRCEKKTPGSQAKGQQKQRPWRRLGRIKRVNQHVHKPPQRQIKAERSAVGIRSMLEQDKVRCDGKQSVDPAESQDVRKAQPGPKAAAFCGRTGPKRPRRRCNQKQRQRVDVTQIDSAASSTKPTNDADPSLRLFAKQGQRKQRHRLAEQVV